MEPGVFAVVLVAAALHATWNAIVKTRGEMLAAMAAVALGEAGLALAVVLVAAPPAAASWPYVAASAALHVGYKSFLALAYRAGDLTQVYPLARGVAPLIVAVVSALVVGEVPTPTGALAVALVAAGLIGVALSRRPGALWSARAVGFALVTGCFIAGYTIVDGLGARISGTPHAYWAWNALIGGAAFIALLAAIRRVSPVTLVRGNVVPGLTGGAASFVAYLLVVWAMSVAPLALVAALRETSILFALAIGAVVLREPIGPRAVASGLAILAGAALLRIGL